MFYPEQTPKYDFPVIYTEEEKLTKKAEYDALTGLPNRFYMMDELTKVFQSGTQAQYYVAMIDIDNFKNIRTERSSFHYTVTIGAGKYQNGQSSKEWIAFVDKQLYVGKCTGKNKVVC